MAGIRNDRDDNVLFVLQLENKSTYEMDQEPIGWDEGQIELIRNKKYHGVFTSFSDSLEFDGYAKDFILDAYKNSGLNTNMYLIKYVKGETDGYSQLIGEIPETKIKWIQEYRGVADYQKMQIKDGKLSINFNSDELEQLIKSHEGDSFDLERTDSIDEKELLPYQQQKVELTPRTISAFAKHKNRHDSWNGGNAYEAGNVKITVETEFISKGFDRHVEVSNPFFDNSSSLNWQANFFLDDIDGSVSDVANLKILWDFDMFLGTTLPVYNLSTWTCWLTFYEFDPETGTYTAGTTASNTPGRFDLFDTLANPIPTNTRFQSQDSITISGIPPNMAMSIDFENSHTAGLYFEPNYDISDSIDGKYEVELEWESKFEETEPTHEFSHIHDVGERLMEILTGSKGKFYSKLFGRNLLRLPPSGTSPTEYQTYEYAETGEHGNVGIIHGLSIRSFTRDNPLYKGLQIGIKTLIESLQSTFNIGVAVETTRGRKNYDSDATNISGDLLRFESLRHFYRDEIGVIFPNQIEDVTRKIEANVFMSSAEFGSSKGGDYENGIGLDEPNVKSSFITPLRKTDKKYVKISKIRSDDYGRELLRRQPMYLGEKEDRTGDDHLWYLNVKKGNENDVFYVQKTWDDELVSEPTGINSPSDYQSWAFTPKRSLLRHGWVIRAGMNNVVDYYKALTLNESNANINLQTQYIGEATPVSESGRVVISSLDRSPITAGSIKFKHKVDSDFYKLVTGTTPIEINGEIEQVPNVYFKFQWTNENEKIETGYFKSYKAKNDEFEFLLANENLIY